MTKYREILRLKSLGFSEYSAQVEHPDRFELNSLTAKTEQSSRRD